MQDAALAVNRILVHIEWAGALFELDDETEALLQIGYAAAAVETASATPRRLPPLWQLDARACGDVLALVQDAYAPTPTGPATWTTCWTG